MTYHSSTGKVRLVCRLYVQCTAGSLGTHRVKLRRAASQVAGSEKRDSHHLCIRGGSACMTCRAGREAGQPPPVWERIQCLYDLQSRKGSRSSHRLYGREFNAHMTCRVGTVGQAVHIGLYSFPVSCAHWIIFPSQCKSHRKACEAQLSWGMPGRQREPSSTLNVPE
jgi:hypothetical protein